MHVAKVVIRNVSAAWIGFGVNLAVIFFLTPFVIRHLGSELYGLWIILQSIVGYYGLVDVGLRAGMVQTITRHIAAKDDKAVARHISTALPVLCSIGLAVMLLAAIVGICIPFFLQIPTEYRHLILPVVVVKSLAFALQLAFAPFGAVLIGLQRFDIENAFAVSTRLIYALAMYLTLEMGGGILGIAIVTALMNLLDGLLRFGRARYMLPCLREVTWRRNRDELREMWKFGIWNTAVHFSRQLIFLSDALVIALLLTPAAVVPFAISGSIVEQCNKLVTQAVRVLFPTMTHLRSANDQVVQRLLYITATRLIAGISLSVLICGTFWIKPFLQLWLSKTEDLETILARSPDVFVVLASASVFVGLHRAGSQLLMAHGKLQVIAMAYLIEGVANLILSLLLGSYLGVLGVALGTLIPSALVALMVHIPAHAKAIEMSSLRLLWDVSSRPLVFAAILFVTIYGIRMSLQEPDSWQSLVMAIVVSAIAVAIVALAVLIPKQQRRFIFSAIRRPIFGVT